MPHTMESLPTTQAAGRARLVARLLGTYVARAGAIGTLGWVPGGQPADHEALFAILAGRDIPW